MTEPEFAGTFTSAPGVLFSAALYRLGAVVNGVVGAGVNMSGRMYVMGHRVNRAGWREAVSKAHGEIMYRRRYDRRRKEIAPERVGR